MRKGIVAAVVIIVVAVAAWLLFANGNSNNNSSLYGNNNNSAAKQTPAASNNNNTASGSQTESAGKVTIANMMFSPSQVTISKGDTVTWTNNDSIAHTVTSDTGSELASGDIQPGSTYSHTFNQTGSFQYHCSIHPSMRGTIVVR